MPMTSISSHIVFTSESVLLAGNFPCLQTSYEIFLISDLDVVLSFSYEARSSRVALELKRLPRYLLMYHLDLKRNHGRCQTAKYPEPTITRQTFRTNLPKFYDIVRYFSITEHELHLHRISYSISNNRDMQHVSQTRSLAHLVRLLIRLFIYFLHLSSFICLLHSSYLIISIEEATISP